MKTALKKGTIKNPIVHFDPTMDKRHENIVVAPEKLEKLNKQLCEKGFPPANFPPQ